MPEIALIDQDMNKPQGNFRHKKTGIMLLLFSALGLLAWTTYLLYPIIAAGMMSFRVFLDPVWAHNPISVELLLQFSLAVWLLFSTLYFSLWMIRRSIRKLQGKTWRLTFKDETLHFFPNILLYLKISCVFLALVWLFVVAQYPLQFLN